MQTPTFSIVVPTCRRPAKLASCLRSLAEQTWPRDDFEVIVVDDANMREAVGPLVERGHPFACHLVSQVNRGAAAARNAGARRGRGRLLAFTDDDCEPEPAWLEQLAEAMAAVPEPETTLVGGRVVNALVRDRFAAASQALVDFMVEQGNLGAAEGRLFTSNNLCVPRAPFHALGGFDERFRGAGGEDREFCLRWDRSGGHTARRSVYAPSAVVRHAHDLNFARFCRQHYAYGRGAALLRQRALVHGYGPLPLERASFYWKLLRHPQQAADLEPRVERSLLFLVSQLANAVGYVRGRFLERA
ncbi:MAG TPA: glycosyltransferase [Polyangiaceae bacterium]